MLQLELDRKNQNAHRTFGELTGPGDFRLCTLELPWRGNAPRVSCIPTGTYQIYRSWYNAKGYEVFELRDVPDRSEILIHIGNYPRDTEGCILVGMSYGVDSIERSREAFAKFMNYMNDVDIATLYIFD